MRDSWQAEWKLQHGKVRESLLGEGVEFPLLDSFQNKSYGRSDRCTGDSAARQRDELVMFSGPFQFYF